MISKIVIAKNSKSIFGNLLKKSTMIIFFKIAFNSVERIYKIFFYFFKIFISLIKLNTCGTKLKIFAVKFILSIAKDFNNLSVPA